MARQSGIAVGWKSIAAHILLKLGAESSERSLITQVARLVA